MDPQQTPKLLLVVLDGFGEGKDYPFNAITRSKMPFYRQLRDKFPRSQLLTSGEAVGLPPGIMGNSEVGHMNMGAGRIVYQELTRIDKDIRDGGFFKNAVLRDACAAVRVSTADARLHVMLLLSDGGVHSHIDHLAAFLKLTADKEVPVTIHAFTDGRDTGPQSGVEYLRRLAEMLQAHPHAVLGSLCGRYYAMDRDKHWERVLKAWNALVGRLPALPSTPSDQNGSATAAMALKASYDAGITDEFLEPVRFSSAGGRSEIRDGDGVFFLNFRADRARQLTRAFTQKNFRDFDTGPRPRLCFYGSMTEYDKTFGLPVAYPPQNLTHMLPDILAEQHLRQFRIAETEKYAHVTFFFNGSREEPYKGEERTLIASPRDVPTYDLRPEMSAPEITEKLVARLERGTEHFILVNYANPDMIGHTGNYEAAVKAMEFLDQCIDRVVSAAVKNGYAVIITADHGNVEKMRVCGHDEQIHTQHTLNPVPVHLIAPQFHYKLREGGVLADVAPTILQIMGLPQPKEMTGQSLLIGSRT